MKKLQNLFFFLTIGLFLIFLGPVKLLSGQADPYDILIINAKVMDGSGNPWFYADIAIKDGKISAIGDLEDKVQAGKIIDAIGKMIVPGFIDIHSHAYDYVLNADTWKDEDEVRYSAPSFLMQGITTLATNLCGAGPLSIKDQRDALIQRGIGPNVIQLVGHNTIRAHVMGKDHQRPANEKEIAEMRKLVNQGMLEGAFGLSVGLEYVPGKWSTTDEIVALTEEAVKHGGLYSAHQRSEGADPMWYLPSLHPEKQPTLLDAVMETIEVGERTGARVIATHIKAKGAHFWGSSAAAINLINQARKRGVDIWADAYVYNSTGSDGVTLLIPRWALAEEKDRPQWEPVKEPRKGLQKTLEDKQQYDKMIGDIKHELRRRGGAENIIVIDYPDKSYIGKTIAELAAEQNISVIDLIIKLQLEGFPDRAGGAHLRGFSLSEFDVENYLKQPWLAVSTDAINTIPQDGHKFLAHARFYGNYPRLFEHYVKKRGVISLEHAVRASTSLPALIFNIKDRGMIQKGYYADIIIMDLETISDEATFLEPHQYPEGIDYVFVNGQVVVENGELTGAKPGIVLSRNK